MIEKKLELPHVRHDLVGALDDLANKERQWREWPSSTAAHRFWDTARFAIHVIFDDLSLEIYPPEEHVGYYFYNEDEAKKLYPVITAINKVCDEIGMNQPDSAYMNSPLWEEVIHTAKYAYDGMIANEPPNSFTLECHKHGWKSWDSELMKESYYKAYPEEKERIEREERGERKK